MSHASDAKEYAVAHGFVIEPNGKRYKVYRGSEVVGERGGYQAVLNLMIDSAHGCGEVISIDTLDDVKKHFGPGIDDAEKAQTFFDDATSKAIAAALNIPERMLAGDSMARGNAEVAESGRRVLRRSIARLSRHVPLLAAQISGNLRDQLPGEKAKCGYTVTCIVGGESFTYIAGSFNRAVTWNRRLYNICRNYGVPFRAVGYGYVG